MMIVKALYVVGFLFGSVFATSTVPLCTSLPSQPAERGVSEQRICDSAAEFILVKKDGDGLMNQVREVALGCRAGERTSSLNQSQADETKERDCQEETERVHAAILEKLQTRPRLTIEQITEDIRKAIGRSPLFGLETLDKLPQPTLLAWFSCPLSEIEGHSTFRIFQFSRGGYRTVVRSEDFPLVEHINRVGQRLDQGALEVKLMPSTSSNQAFFLTRWIVSGSSPQIFSVVLWKWDGQTVKPIWERLDLHYASFKVLGTIIMLSIEIRDDQGLEEGDQRPTWRDEIYRLEKGRVVFDGLLNQALAERYLRQGIINPSDAESLTQWAYIFRRFDDKMTAIQLLEQAVSANPKYTFSYYTLSQFYEEQGDYAKAALWMRKLGEAAGGLSEQGKQHLNELERKAKGEP